jgi:YgiT-type zinc finger domain-containing protein
MKCVICKNGQTTNKNVTVTLDINNKTFVFKDVPALVCENCSEQYLEEETSRRLLAQANAVEKIGIELTISKYKAA